VKPTRITVNGRDYASLEAMPADVRRLYEEALRGTPPLGMDGNHGAADWLEGVEATGGISRRVITSQTIVVNGSHYASLEEVPDEHREAIESALGRMSKGEGTRVHHAEVEWTTGPRREGRPPLRLVGPEAPESGPVEIRFSISPWMMVGVLLVVGLLVAIFLHR
jgi:hypothetical protein